MPGGSSNPASKDDGSREITESLAGIKLTGRSFTYPATTFNQTHTRPSPVQTTSENSKGKSDTHLSPKRALLSHCLPQIASHSVDEDKFKLLKRFDTVFLVDDSASMQLGPDGEGALPQDSNWAALKTGIRAFVSIASRFDDDGIDLYCLKNRTKFKEGVSATAHVSRLLDSIDLSDPTSGGGTYAQSPIRDIVEPRMDKLRAWRAAKNADCWADDLPKIKPLNLIVVTDGIFDDSDNVEDYLVQVVVEMILLKAPPKYIGIQFIQIGRDEASSQLLGRFDDELKDKIEDGLKSSKVKKRKAIDVGSLS